MKLIDQNILAVEVDATDLSTVYAYHLGADDRHIIHVVQKPTKQYVSQLVSLLYSVDHLYSTTPEQFLEDFAEPNGHFKEVRERLLSKVGERLSTKETDGDPVIEVVK